MTRLSKLLLFLLNLSLFLLLFNINNPIQSNGLINPIIPVDFEFKDNMAIHMHNASIFESKNDTLKAIEEYKNALEYEPRNIIAHFKLGMLYYNLWEEPGNSYDDQVEALKYLNMAEEEFLWVKDISPQITMSYFKLGRISTLKGNREKALSYYNKGIELSPDNIALRFNLASLYDDNNDIEMAIIHYKECIKINKNFTHAYNNLALIYERQGYINKSIKLYKKTLSLDEKHVYALINLGNLLTLKKQYDKASGYLVKATTLYPNNPWTHLHLGNLYEEQKQYNLALEEYYTFLKQKPNNSKGYYLLCNLLKKMDLKEEALTAGILYLRLDPNGIYSLDVKEIIKNIQTTIVKSPKVSSN